MQVSGNIQTYWLLLKDLDKESKLSLIELLIQSLKKSSVKKTSKNIAPIPNNSDWIDEFYGCWNSSDETAEDIITKIESSRTMGREKNALDSIHFLNAFKLFLFQQLYNFTQRKKPA